MRTAADINRGLVATGKPLLENVFAVRTGEAIVGNIGSEARTNHTIIGDNADLTHDLCQLNHRYGTRILISEPTWHQVKHRYHCRLVDKVVVGATGPGTRIFELLSEKTETSQVAEGLPPHRYE
jgi:adenylate cyclase